MITIMDTPLIHMTDIFNIIIIIAVIIPCIILFYFRDYII